MTVSLVTTKCEICIASLFVGVTGRLCVTRITSFSWRSDSLFLGSTALPNPVEACNRRSEVSP